MKVQRLSKIHKVINAHSNYVFMIIVLIGYKWNSIPGNFVNATIQETAALAILSESNLAEE